MPVYDDELQVGDRLPLLIRVRGTNRILQPHGIDGRHLKVTVFDSQGNLDIELTERLEPAYPNRPSSILEVANQIRDFVRSHGPGKIPYSPGGRGSPLPFGNISRGEGEPLTIWEHLQEHDEA